MARWLVILSLAVVQCPDVAVASPGSSDVPVWRKLLSVFKPATKPDRREQAQHLGGVATPPPSEAAAGSGALEQGTELSRGQAGCSGGKRVVSAYYWHGRRTASGQPFNPQDMTAAHRTLPFGTRLTVTNPRTGRSVVVIVNDRGPFVSGVGLDLSLGAAQAIGMHGTGSVCIS